MKRIRLREGVGETRGEGLRGTARGRVCAGRGRRAGEGEGDKRRREKREGQKGGGTVAVGWRRRDENGAFPKAKYPKSSEQLDESCSFVKG